MKAHGREIQFCDLSPSGEANWAKCLSKELWKNTSEFIHQRGTKGVETVNPNRLGQLSSLRLCH